jgi:hypothetical protein
LISITQSTPKQAQLAPSRSGIAIEMVLATTPLALPVLSVCSPSVSFTPPSLIVNLRQVAAVVNPAFQALLSVQVVLVLEWIVLLVLTSKSAQPVTNDYLRNSAFAGIAVMSPIITEVVAPVTLKPSTT